MKKILPVFLTLGLILGLWSSQSFAYTQTFLDHKSVQADGSGSGYVAGNWYEAPGYSHEPSYAPKYNSDNPRERSLSKIGSTNPSFQTSQDNWQGRTGFHDGDCYTTDDPSAYDHTHFPYGGVSKDKKSKSFHWGTGDCWDHGDWCKDKKHHGHDCMPTPIPGTVLLLGSGFVGLGLLGWRRKKRV